ncbi:CRISPR-associated protein, TM1812 family [Thioalkalivibrio sulfidiphilus HL-EbGr7]|uniref:CRISPR-associated protein, TM1812 family n=1 Tax=Thioalkalivibrio sulfidiphilus (strain HL-EbGR7) TaxID=396588 RepID=B8GSI1_THISH|nr:TIGR02221 family CRISPR-associated protein [Thioalkalivibrio sulfidiphilus]ACL72885.1 CRISPR-associated protein, TM1812 family [Thioalkalivibrio sulfidiphilus HL-EbGr7]
MNRHTLITFLGKGARDPNTGYRSTTYRFADRDRSGAFFGLLLAQHLAPDRLLILGTRSSQWDLLVESLAGSGEDEEARLALMEAVSEGAVTPRLLERVRPLMERAVGIPLTPCLIPFGEAQDEQLAILDTIATHVPGGEVSFDLTHGFRHMGMLGFLSAFMLERIGHLRVRGLWYGALDMSRDNITPVVRLDGLSAVRHWIEALSHFEATGDYGVFASLLVADGVAEDKARCLEEAAFHERTFNLLDAVRKLRTFLPVLDTPLGGASGLFQAVLLRHLEWSRESSLDAYQKRLSRAYLHMGDFVRAVIFGWEAVITRHCLATGRDPRDFALGRKAAAEDLDADVRNGIRDRDFVQAYWTIKNLRNSLAHGNPPKDKDLLRVLKSEQDTRRFITESLQRLLD